jgi:hypothetical protein
MMEHGLKEWNFVGSSEIMYDNPHVDLTSKLK